MSADKRLNLVICWHMRQPQYCDLISGLYQLPWSYLHATKDYIDMAAHLKAVPGAKAVVNFAPILLEQLSDYAGQVNGFLSEHKPIRDPLLAALAYVLTRQGDAVSLITFDDAIRDRLPARAPAQRRLRLLAHGGAAARASRLLSA